MDLVHKMSGQPTLSPPLRSYAHDEAFAGTGSPRTHHRSASASRTLCINPRNFQLCPETRRHAVVTRPFWYRPSHLTGGRQRLPSWALHVRDSPTCLPGRWGFEQCGPAAPPAAHAARQCHQSLCAGAAGAFQKRDEPGRIHLSPSRLKLWLRRTASAHSSGR
eukprot:COSAG03_NODE_886_length_5486_cov_6.922591_2_plen_163_part_00